MKANKSTVSIPLASKNYEISMRQKVITRPNGTDIVCIGTLCRNGKPVAAVAPKQRTVHYEEDIPTAITQISNDFEQDIRKLFARSSPQEKASTAIVESPLLEGIRRIRNSGIIINPKNGNRGWSPRTQESYLSIFGSQIVPLLQPYVSGEKNFLPSDLGGIATALKSKKAQHSRSNGRQSDLEVSTYTDLAAADVIYQFIRAAYPDLGLPELNLAPAPRRKIGVRKEQEKSLPESVCQKLCRYVDAHWAHEPRFCYALTLMLCGGLRTAEAAGTRPEKIEHNTTYAIVKVRAQEKGGKIDKILKRDSSYRGVIIGCWASNILRQCTDEIQKNDPDWRKDETAPVCLAQNLSAWVLARLYECGLSEAFFADAHKCFAGDVYFDKDGKLVEDFSAYILRRDWASRARNICGYTSLEIDQQLGHKVTVPKSRRPNLKLATEQEKLAVKAERYVYSPAETQNPEYAPISLKVGVRWGIPTYTNVKYCNSSDKPMLVTVTFGTQENEYPAQLTAPCGAMRKPVVTSRPDDPTQRQNRPIIGSQSKED